MLVNVWSFRMRRRSDHYHSVDDTNNSARCLSMSSPPSAAAQDPGVLPDTKEAPGSPPSGHTIQSKHSKLLHKRPFRASKPICMPKQCWSLDCSTCRSIQPSHSSGRSIQDLRTELSPSLTAQMAPRQMVRPLDGIQRRSDG